jgi:hypothetical protein
MTLRTYTGTTLLNAQRKVESTVRAIVLKICGIAASHPRCPPAFVSAVMAIRLYGEFFVDERERRAISHLFERMEDLHAWPVRDAHLLLKRNWDLLDSFDL